MNKAHIETQPTNQDETQDEVVKYWVCDDSGNEDVVWAESPEDAAREYVEAGGEDSAALSTQWCDVWVWTDEDEDRERVKVAIEPDEPACTSETGHDWRRPVAIVGGIDENPGCFGQGGGIVQLDCCMECGCRRRWTNWGQDMSDGTQGLEATSYEPSYYADEVEELAEDDEIEDDETGLWS